MNSYSSTKLQPLTDEQIRARAPSVFATAAHESRSDRYAYIATSALLEGMRREGFLPVAVEQSRSRVPGKQAFTKHQIRFNHAASVARAVGDSIPQVVLTNSHDGSSAYALDLGIFRLVCLNGMMVSDRSWETLKVPHTGKVLDRVIEGSYTVIGEAQRIGERVEQFRAIELAPQEQLAMARAALQLRFEPKDGEAPPISPEQALETRRPEDRGADLWRTLNRLQESVIRGGQRYVIPGHRTESGRYVPGRRMQAREVRGIDQSSNLNRALWRLADEMRALKTAA